MTFGFEYPRKVPSWMNDRHRVAFGKTSMKPSIAHCLLKLAQPQLGDVLLDMCAGSATFAIECAKICKGVHFIAGDSYKPVIDTAIANV